MSDWQQISNISSTPIRDAVATTITPSSSETNRNYYNPLPDFESDTDLDLNESDPDSVVLDQDFWADEEIFWEEVRRKQVQDPLDAEDQIEFSYNSDTTDSDAESISDSKDNTIMTDYKSVADFMEIK